MKGNSVIGLAAIGFGILFLWSAYTKKPLFGTNGLIPEFFKTENFEQAGAATRKNIAKSKPSSTSDTEGTVTV
jgi:hypothetical protein